LISDFVVPDDLSQQRWVNLRNIQAVQQSVELAFAHIASVPGIARSGSEQEPFLAVSNVRRKVSTEAG